MFGFSKLAPPSIKCGFTHTTLPAFVDEKQRPLKLKPFANIVSQEFNYAVDLLLPDEIYKLLEQELRSDVYSQQYSRVYMSLSDIIEKDFFNEYVKTGNVMMLSEGRPSVDNLFYLRDGVLRLEVDQPTYERVGLVGRPIPSGGRKHTKARFLIELNLRLPTLQHGRKGFNRIERAFKNVLNHSLSWLFYGPEHPAQTPEVSVELPIAKHHPFQEPVRPEVNRIKNAQVPVFVPSIGLDDHEYAAELLEWIGLTMLDSPRIRADDSIDSYLSRYRVPIVQDAEGREMDVDTTDLVVVKWRGFIPPSFVESLFTKVRRLANKKWFALSACGFQDEGYSIVNSGREVLTWEWPMTGRQ